MQLTSALVVSVLAVPALAAPPALRPSLSEDICLRICAYEPIECPEGWQQKNLGDCNTCCRDDSYAIEATKAVQRTANHHHHGVALAKALAKARPGDICWRACFAEEPSCPETWSSRDLGGCWTCCRDEPDDDSSALEVATAAEVTALSMVSVEAGQACLMVCWSEEQQCPEAWSANQFGDCWTRCRDASDSRALESATVIKAKAKALSTTPTGTQSYCLKVCWPEEPQCPLEWTSKQYGDCWTCCHDDTAALGLHASKAPALPTIPVQTESICLMACWSEEPQCPPDWSAQQFGDCWTCCRDEPAATALEFPAKNKKAVAAYKTTTDDFCWSGICFPEEHSCPQPSYAVKLGDCWTCCVDSLAVALNVPATTKKAVTNLNVKNEDFCWLTCFPEEPSCPGDLKPKKQFDDCWTCCLDSGAAALDVPASNKKAVTNHYKAKNDDVCWRTCFPEEPECPGDMKAKQFGPCWTCCYDTDSDALKAPALNKKALAVYEAKTGDVCMMSCFSDKPTCPEPSYPKQFGDCWTCCIDSGEAALQAPSINKKAVDLYQAKTDEVCWMVCFPEKPTCPSTGYAKQFGECWTCCIKPDTDALTLAAPTGNQKALALHKSKNDEICWMACFPEGPTCPKPWHAKQEGECWTCCYESEGGDDAPEAPVVTQKTLQVQEAVALLTSPVHAQDRCLPMCAEEPVNCPPPLQSRQLEDRCNSCCFADGSVGKKTTSFYERMKLVLAALRGEL